MDWKYKQFHQERSFAASRDEVISAARRFMSESLNWEVTETPLGLNAEGNNFGHVAKVMFTFQSSGSETKVVIDLMVQRAGTTGFMLFDVGGYYTIQIRKWLEGIQLAIHQARSGAVEQSPIPVPNANKTGARLFNGCMMVTFAILGLWFLGNFISAIIGLATGTLYLWGKGGTLVLHGMTARIAAALIVAFGVFLAWQVTRTRRRRA